MNHAQVYFTDFHTIHNGDGLALKLQSLIKKAGIGQIDMDGKFVAIKIHFGERGNLSFVRPNYARAVVDVVKELGGIPFLTDCNTMYPGSRKNAIEHMWCAWENGFTPLTVGCPIIIGDGLKGTDDVSVPVVNGEYVKEAKIGRAIMDADVIITLSHFKGHEAAGFGGAMKNLGMGCGSRAGKTEQHSSSKPVIVEENCRGCRSCLHACANGGLLFDEAKKKMTLTANCVGCAKCLGYCNFDAIEFEQNNASDLLNCRMAEYAKAVVDGRPQFHISLAMDISPFCDCHAENDAPILPNVGMFASFDPIAIDQACVDACMKKQPIPGSLLYQKLQKNKLQEGMDYFNVCKAGSSWKACLNHGVKIGLGTRDYDLIEL